MGCQKFHKDGPRPPGAPKSGWWTKKGTGCRCVYFGNIPLALFPVKKCKNSVVVEV